MYADVFPTYRKYPFFGSLRFHIPDNAGEPPMPKIWWKFDQFTWQIGSFGNEKLIQRKNYDHKFDVNFGGKIQIWRTIWRQFRRTIRRKIWRKIWRQNSA